MSDGRRIRLVPVRQGQPLAGLWSFFYQGDDFYASSQAFLEGWRAKISFHSSGQWQFRIGHMEKKLLSNKPAEGNWIHALQLHFLFPWGMLRPYKPIPPRVVSFEVGDDQKLRIDLFVSRNPPALNKDGKFEYPTDGDYYVAILRSGNHQLIVPKVQTMTWADRKCMRSVLDQSPTLKYSAAIDYKQTYSEMIMLSAQEDSWNSAVVVPIPRYGVHDPTTLDPNIIYWIDEDTPVVQK
jgi:hypothetical protein